MEPEQHLRRYCCTSLGELKTVTKLKNTVNAIGVIQSTLGIGKRPILRAKVTRSGDGVCELITETGEPGMPGRKIDLRSTSKHLQCEGGLLKVTKSPGSPPRAGSQLLIVMTSSKKDCCRIESWGHESELLELQEGQPAIGSGSSYMDVSSESTDKNSARVNDPRFQVKKPAIPVNRKRFLKQMLAGVTKRAG